MHNYTNLPLSNGIKIVSVLQRLHDEIGRTNSVVQKRDGQTDRQRFWIGAMCRPSGAKTLKIGLCVTARCAARNAAGNYRQLLKRKGHLASVTTGPTSR